MLRIQQGNRVFNYRVAGIAIHENRVLLHQLQGDDSWSLPEEINAPVTIRRLLPVVENFFELTYLIFHEVGMYFVMHVPLHIAAHTQRFIGIEGDSLLLTFEWVRLDSLSQRIIKPDFLPAVLTGNLDGIQHLVHSELNR